MFGLDHWSRPLRRIHAPARRRRRAPARAPARDRPGPPRGRHDAPRRARRGRGAHAGFGSARGAGHATHCSPSGCRSSCSRPSCPRASRKARRLWSGSDRRARGLAAGAVAARALPRPSARARGRSIPTGTFTPASTRIARGAPARPCRPTGSGSCTGSAAAPAWVSSCWRRSTPAVAVVALALFAFFTAVSMTLLSAGFGATLARPAVQRGFHALPRCSASRASPSGSGTRSARRDWLPTSSRGDPGG